MCVHLCVADNGSKGEIKENKLENKTVQSVELCQMISIKTKNKRHINTQTVKSEILK